MEISFYEVKVGNLIPSLVRLLSKIYAAKQRCIFFSPNVERVKALDKALWTSTKDFIPHGDKNLGFESQQPIYLTSTFENPNDAVVLVMTDTFDFERYKGMEKVLLFFDVGSEKAGELARNLKNEQKNVNCWEQSSKGWIKLL